MLMGLFDSNRLVGGRDIEFKVSGGGLILYIFFNCVGGFFVKNLE